MDKPSSSPELLAPAGNLEKFRTALLYGADAIYLGGRQANLREGGAGGFSGQDLDTALKEAKNAGVRCYFCLNSIPRQSRMSGIPALIEETAAKGVDAFIIADPGILHLARRYAPEVPLHLSTQANTTNAHAVAFWAGQGVSRINLARELSGAEMYSIREAVSRTCPAMELEVFVHGSMCLAVSGQCLMSAWLNDRPANEGQCTQPCRFAYRKTAMADCPDGTACARKGLVLEEATRPGEELWTVSHDGEFSEVWAPDDLCLMHYLPWLAQSGFRSLKIEGRCKSSAYLAHTVDAYATALAEVKAINRAEEDAKTRRSAALRPEPGAGESKSSGPQAAFDPMPYMAELLHSATRPLSSGFFLSGARRNFSAEALPHLLRKADSSLTKPILARVAEPLDGKSGAWLLEIRGQWRAGLPVEIMLPGLRRPVLAPGKYFLENHKGEKIQVINSGLRAVLYCDHPDILPGAFIRSCE